MGVPYLGLGFRQGAVDGPTMRVTDRPVFWGPCCVVVIDGRMGHQGTVADPCGSGKRGGSGQPGELAGQKGDKLRLHEGETVWNVEADHPLAAQMRAKLPLQP